MGASIINRSGADILINEQFTNEIIQGAIAQSTVLSQFRQLPRMQSNKLSMPVLEMLPLAYFVNGDTGMKQTTKMMWDHKTIYAEEIAVILPIPEAVLDDASYDIIGQAKPRIEEAFGKVIDNAILFGINKPKMWRSSLVTSIKESGNTVTLADNMYSAIMGKDGVISKVEMSGFTPNGVIAGVNVRGKLRDVVDKNGQPIFRNGMQGSTSYSLDGMPMYFANNGAWDSTKVDMIVGDMSHGVYSIRQDMTFKILSEGVIQDPETKEIVYNLAQQDMVALRCVMRLGWEIPNPVSAMAEDESKRFPFALLEPSSVSAGQTVTFTVTDSESSNVEGAKVTLGGNVKKTGSNGQAVFTHRKASMFTALRKTELPPSTAKLLSIPVP